MMLDSIQYFLFPNFCPWFGEGLPLTYPFRPNADSPDNAPAPPAPKMVKLGPNQPFEPVIGAMGTIFDQDDANIPNVQLGLKTWPGDSAGATLARYQESRIRHFHHVPAKVIPQP